MIHVVTHENRALYARELLMLHRLKPRANEAAAPWAEDARHGWGAYDRGDDERAIYFLALDSAGAPEYGCRVRPTDDWCVLASEAGHLVGPDEPPIAGQAVWELTRLNAAPHLMGPEPPNVARRGELRLAIIEEAHERGVKRILTVVETAKLPSALRSGWRLRLLGLPGDFAGVCAEALEIEASREAVADLRERLAAGPSRRLHLPGHQSLGEAPLKEIELFLEAAQRLRPDQLKPLLVALRAAIEDEGED